MLHVVESEAVPAIKIPADPVRQVLLELCRKNTVQERYCHLGSATLNMNFRH